MKKLIEAIQRIAEERGYETKEGVLSYKGNQERSIKTSITVHEDINMNKRYQLDVDIILKDFPQDDDLFPKVNHVSGPPNILQRQRMFHDPSCGQLILKMALNTQEYAKKGYKRSIVNFLYLPVHNSHFQAENPNAFNFLRLIFDTIDNYAMVYESFFIDECVLPTENLIPTQDIPF